MKIEQKHLALGGFVLMVAILVAGILFAPSGYLSAEAGATQGIACMQLNTQEICETESVYWTTHPFNSKESCDSARDESGKSCAFYGCTCKYLKTQ